MNSITLRKPIIKVIDEDYVIPHLNSRRRVAAILPHDYEYSNKHYPVLYLHDGQNLFDEQAPFGNWGVDKKLTLLAEQGIEVIVIAIDHGGKERIAEYLPYDSPKFTEKKGELYIQFMMEDLKPYVDRNFRVKTEREYTGIGGSSMGGLISLYAGFHYSEVFGNMMIFSPSIWISEQVFNHAALFSPKGDTKIYLYSGGQESHSLKPAMDFLGSILKSRKNAHSMLDIMESHNPIGTHQEYYWGQEFPKALTWLYTN
ncbi:MAG: alpha/beta hydrolase [Saprospiraceae bacterium]|nr:alpha/beta hydrolase [Saprospiraceae bacterium]